ncbi:MULTISPECIES: DUF411 domain-containing protein [unclassified Duganella]|jgi:hypothetical protein|uniref:DUF411 domain-containing protein n=1 Tax=unclassified Duganella TaxID=2636909 RepID=UPI00087FCDF8|nr:MULTISPECIES: DUF411 domain-containing protein [unclassified Duganella]SDF75465.1 Uncharacterized conserved protein [Duganella sp. OV458]SDI54158.1 Uncharacterized conserved protein [Duganella sp. OV510]
MKRKNLARLTAAACLLIQSAAWAAAPVIDVYKTATCGCCKEWAKHLEKNGFTVHTHDVANPSDYREKYGIPQQFGSCHTGVVQGYALEGHVPAAEVRRLLAQKPKARGLAVPAMPMGSPGMEGPRSDPYDVYLIKQDGKASVYQHYGPK